MEIIYIKNFNLGGRLLIALLFIPYEQQNNLQKMEKHIAKIKNNCYNSNS